MNRRKKHVIKNFEDLRDLDARVGLTPRQYDKIYGLVVDAGWVVKVDGSGDVVTVRRGS